MSGDGPTRGSSPGSAPTESRRPIRARGARWVHALVDRLDRLGVSPNAVSVLSVVCSAAGAISIGVSASVGPTTAALLLASAPVWIGLRSLCNLLDGLIAVEKNRGRPSGIVFNEFPDRVSDVFFFVGAGLAAMPVELGVHLGWAAAAVALLTAYGRAFGAACGGGHDFRGPMAKPHRMAVLALACLSASVEDLTVGTTYALSAGLVVVIAGGVVTIARRLRALVATLESTG